MRWIVAFGVIDGAVPAVPHPSGLKKELQALRESADTRVNAVIFQIGDSLYEDFLVDAEPSPAQQDLSRKLCGAPWPLEVWGQPRIPLNTLTLRKRPRRMDGTKLVSYHLLVANMALVALAGGRRRLRSMAIVDKERPLPGSQPDPKDIRKLYDAVRKSKAKLVGSDGGSRPLPDSLYAFLVELSGALQQGKYVSILKTQAPLTTAEAASAIGVSRQFLVNLLEAGEIPYHKVGTHRRIYVQDLMKYKAHRDQRRKKVLRDLAAAEVREGLYDKVPPMRE
jgi:excisionase family DNA binding protein